jgi:hypothetical protein
MLAMPPKKREDSKVGKPKTESGAKANLAPYKPKASKL